MIESSWGRMETELLDRKRWVTILELSAAIAGYIDSFPNDKRRHSSLDMLTSTDYEQLHAPVLQLAWARPKSGGEITTHSRGDF